MTILEKEWLLKCKQNPDKYKIWVDNDIIYVDDLQKEECVFDFENYGYEFVKDLLEHLGYNVDFV